MYLGKLENIFWWVVIVLLVVTCLIDYTFCEFSRKYAFIFTISYNLTVSSLAALIILFFQRKDTNHQIAVLYKQIAGNYTRTVIKEPGSQSNKELQDKHLNKEVVLTHLGGHLIKFTTKYWDFKIEGIIEFSENSQFVGNGTYHYLDNPELDVGVYKIQRFPDKPNILYAYYENTIPKNGASGYEVWERK